LSLRLSSVAVASVEILGPVLVAARVWAAVQASAAAQVLAVA